MNRKDFIKIMVVFGLVLTAYIPTFLWMFERWSSKDSYYSHGFLIPIISLALIWIKREELSKIKLTPLAGGWILFILAILIHLISALLRVYFTSGFSIIITLSGLVLLFLGKEFFKQLLFPISFLIFMIPLPLVAIANISFKLKIFAAQIATLVINALGVEAVRDGSIIKTAHSYLIVEDPCSGIRSLIALIALGAVMTYLSKISKTKKAILFLSTMPIAIFSNVIRIVALTLASDMYGAKFASGFFHDMMGVLVFVISFLGLLLIEKVLE